MAGESGFTDFLCDTLSPLGPVRVRRMFGGAGLFLEGVMFGLVAYDEFYLKTDADADPVFAAAGCPSFRYEAAGRPAIVMSYRRIPEAALDDPAELLRWARVGVEAAFRADAAKPPAKRKRKG
jgi:DNA transformation protein